MTQSPFQKEWLEISERLRLTIRLSYTLTLNSTEITVPVLLEDYGAPNGMLLVTDSGNIHGLRDEIIDMGYGYSCLSEPSGDPIDWVAVDEMLGDWGRV